MTIVTPDKESDLLTAAIQAAEELAGVRIRIEPDQRRVVGRVDALLTVEGAPGYFIPEIRNRATQANLDAIIYQIHRIAGDSRRGMLIADYVNPRMAERLKAEDIAFIDTAGNAFINASPVYIYVKGQGKPLSAAVPKGNRAFEPTGLKVIFAFLCNPKLVNAPYRTIADVADVALGTVGWVVRGLKEVGSLADEGNGEGRRIINYQKLLDRWVEDYPLKLKPKQLIGTFTTENLDWWKELDLSQYGALLGGETAAAKITRYLKPKVTTLYTQEIFKNPLFAKARFRKADKLLTSDEPVINVYRLFWNEEDRRDYFVHPDKKLPKDIVHPILIYADLVATGNARNRETAELIYEDYIAQYCREN